MSGEELLALAERVEALDGPGREVDAEIAIAAKAVPYDFEPAFGTACWRAMYDNRHWDAPAYTASLDAACTLVPEGCAWGATNIEGGDYEEVNFARSTAVLHAVNDAIELCRSDAATPALALCAAALRAHAQRERDQ